LEPIEIQTESASPSVATSASKVATANRDRVLLTRAVGILIFLVGIVNMVPSYLFWSRWSQQIVAPPLPQWVYWQVFIAALCLVYAVFLWQIADWSALKSVAIVMLIIAMGYGLITVSLMLGGEQSPAARWLSLKGQTLDRGQTWCATMLCVATLISYLGGRESSKWKRANSLLDKINSDRQTGKTAS